MNGIGVTAEGPLCPGSKQRIIKPEKDVSTSVLHRNLLKASHRDLLSEPDFVIINLQRFEYVCM